MAKLAYRRTKVRRADRHRLIVVGVSGLRYSLGQRNSSMPLAVETGYMSMAKGRKLSLPLKVRKEIEELREPFMVLVHPPSRRDFAVRFVSTFNRWKAHYSNVGEYATYADFIRLFDPSVPEGSSHYRYHRAYQRADDFRKLVAGTGSRRRRNEM